MTVTLCLSESRLKPQRFSVRYPVELVSRALGAGPEDRCSRA